MVRRVESGNTDTSDTGPESQCYTVTESEWPLQTAASGDQLRVAGSREWPWCDHNIPERGAAWPVVRCSQ